MVLYLADYDVFNRANSWGRTYEGGVKITQPLQPRFILKVYREGFTIPSSTVPDPNLAELGGIKVLTPFGPPKLRLRSSRKFFLAKFFFPWGDFKGPRGTLDRQKKNPIFINKIWRNGRFLLFSVVSLRGCRPACSIRKSEYSSPFIAIE